ncbi:MAG: hypothetical protein CL927_11325 [Deltaproteobacteria bacterium]|nr:hypothetical protein [Deltaproteobacteria bacterium]HCH63411.1 hypothetical protein [Deltaproteobacteria bacterium]
MPRWTRALGGLGALVGAATVGLAVALSHRMPEATPGTEALARAARIEAAVGIEAWDALGAVAFTFAGRNVHLWDRQRGLHRVKSGRNTVIYDLNTRQGRAWRGSVELDGPALDAALERAWSTWCNDTFWLNPLAKLRDPGVSLGAVDLEGGAEGLLVQYAQGGVSPGDSYLWILDETGLPVAWRLWVSVIPIPGFEMSWEDWTVLPGGARVATRHSVGPFPLRITHLRAAPTLAELVDGADPFAPIWTVHRR